MLGSLVWPSAVLAGQHAFYTGAYAYGTDGSLGRIGLQRDWDAKWLADGDWYLGGLWEFALGRWWGKEENNLWEVGLTPVFRLQRYRPFSNGIRPWFELGIGAHVLSQTRYSDKQLSTNFQFGDHLGAGFSFGDQQQYSITYRAQHLSNGGIKHPNPGVEFNILQFAYRYN